MSNYSLFSRFEDALMHFHDMLSKASIHYKSLFMRLLDGEDIHKELIEDVYFSEIQQLRQILHEEQMRISRVLGATESFFTISKIQDLAKHRLSIDVVDIAKTCMTIYSEIDRYMNAIEEYYSSKVDEYKSFFDRVYKDFKQNNLYNEEGQSTNSKQGALIQTRA